MLNNNNTVDPKITDALLKYNYEEISNKQLAQHMGFTPDEERMLTMFWQPAFNGSWIYLSPEMITEDMGYKQVSHFYKDTLRPNYKIDIDYVEIDKTDDLVLKYTEYKKKPSKDGSSLGKAPHTGGKAKKYYKVTGRTLKKMLMKCGTKKGDKVCDYYLKVEQLAIFMKDYIVALHSHILQKEIEEKDKLIKIGKEDLYRIHNVNMELLSFKKLTQKKESIYILASYKYATQGIFKIGRTKCMKTRTQGHNTTHIAGDKVKVLKEFKVNDSVAAENYIHRKLKGLLVNGEKEFFVCPYDLLESLIDTIINNDITHNDLVNSVIDTVYKLKCVNYTPDRWMTGIDQTIFREEFQLIDSSDESKDPQIMAKFDVSLATDTQKKLFISGCMEAYRTTISEPNNIIWKTFQEYLKTQLHIQHQIPKYKYKSLQWKPMFNEIKSDVILRIE
jgi:hypothetical protein